MPTNALNYIINLNNGNFGRGMEQAQAQVSKLDNLVQKVGGTIAATFAIDRALQLTEEVTDLKAKFEAYDNTIKFASGGIDNYNKNTKFLHDSITNLKLPIEQTTNSFAQFLAGVKGTSLEGDLARKIFSGVSTAATTLHLSGDKVERTFNALTQMMGKGKVQSEELRGQLGESLPGAFNLAAKAMGVTTKQLNKMLDDGKVLPEVLLPKLADELLKTFGPGVQNAVGSLQAKLNESTNAIINQKVALGDQLAPVHLAWLNLQMQGFEILRIGIDLYKQYEQYIKIAAITIGSIIVVFEGYAFILSVVAAAQNAFNMALAANPISAVIIAGISLIGVIAALNTHTSKAATTIDHLSDKLHLNQTAFNMEMNAIKNGNWTVDERAKLINDLNSKYADYLPNLISEKDNVKALAVAQEAANKAFEEKILLQTKESVLKPLMDELAKIKAAEFQNKVFEARHPGSRSMILTEDENGNSVSAGERVKQLMETINNTNQDYDKLFTNLGFGGGKKSKGSKSGSIGGGGGTESVTGRGGSSVKNVTINIGHIKTADKLVIETTNLQNLSHSQIEQIITDSLVRAAHDGEVVIASN